MKFLKSRHFTILLLLVGAAFVAIGVWQEETEEVYRKAINICMECIGLG